MSTFLRVISGALILLTAALACSLPGVGDGVELQQTQVALSVQQTSLANQQNALTAGAAPVNPLPEATYPPYPTFPAASAGAGTAAPPTQVDMDDLIRGSNILIYEDIVGYTSLVPIVETTLNAMNFSGGKVIHVGDALGDFKQHATSAVPWDLIIVAGEVRSSFSGEMFEMMYDHIDRGGAVIIEAWYLDSISQGKVSPILSGCGVSLFRDWNRDPGDDPFDFSIYWLDSAHPLLSTPNFVQSPSDQYPYWGTDAGDLLELSSGGDATLVAGLYPNRKSDYGVVASCMEGRMIIQTFSSHEYEWDIVLPLWENYITYTLTSHYQFSK